MPRIFSQNLLTLPLTLPLTENRGLGPRFIYGRRSLPSKNDLDFKDFKDFDFICLAFRINTLIIWSSRAMNFFTSTLRWWETVCMVQSPPLIIPHHNLIIQFFQPLPQKHHSVSFPGKHCPDRRTRLLRDFLYR